MTNSELMLQAIADGSTDDGTTAAALDAIREETGCNLLNAVIEVAGTYRVSKNAREITAAQELLRETNQGWRVLRRSITRACPNLPDDVFSWIMVVEGEEGPRATLSVDGGTGPVEQIACILVGALWVTREADRLGRQRQQRAAARRRRRSR